MTLTFDPLTVNVCNVSTVTWSNSVSNFIEIEQFAAQLLRFLNVEFGAVRHLGFDQKWIFMASGVHNVPVGQLSTKSGNARPSTFAAAGDQYCSSVSNLNTHARLSY